MTYAGAHGPHDDVEPVNWVLHREWVMAREVHSLSVRRAETTRIALADLEASPNHLRLALGVAVGALLAVGTFAAGSFSDTNESMTTASAVPEHVFASLDQRLSMTEPVADAPAPVTEQPQEPAPAPAEPQADAVAQDHAVGGGEPSTPAPPPAPAPAPTPPQDGQWGSGGHWGSDGHWGSGGQWGSDGQWGSGGQWGSDGQWGSGSQWGSDSYRSYDQGSYGSQWSPVSGFGSPTLSSYSAATATPAGPAMSSLDPFCNMAG